MLDYDLEAATYDETRGGVERARAAAEAVLELVPREAAVLADVACGTGIVSELLKAPGRRVIGLDASAGMLAVAKPRLGGVARADATRLPLGTGTVDAVTFMWLLHLVDAEVVTKAIAEAARVLRPGGVMVTTVNKDSVNADSDTGRLLRSARAELGPTPTDDVGVVAAVAGRAALEPAGRSGYVGHGQGKTPRRWAQLVREELSWARNADRSRVEDLARALEALPEPDVRRADPVYRVMAFRKKG